MEINKREGEKMVQKDKNTPVRATKRSIKDMLQDVTDAKKSLLGKQVRHNKSGNLYTVFGITIGVATQAPMVHYKDAQDIEWTRTLDNFLSVDTIEGNQVQKFEFVTKL